MTAPHSAPGAALSATRRSKWTSTSDQSGKFMLTRPTRRSEKKAMSKENWRSTPVRRGTGRDRWLFAPFRNCLFRPFAARANRTFESKAARLTQERIQARRLTLARRVCPGLADSAESHWADTRAILGSRRQSAFCPRPRFPKRYTNSRHQRLSSAVPIGSIHRARMVSTVGRRKRRCLESFARLKSCNAVLSKLRKNSG